MILKTIVEIIIKIKNGEIKVIIYTGRECKISVYICIYIYIYILLVGS